MTRRYRTANGHPRSAISYIGGKSRLIDHIVPIIEYAAQAYDLNSYYEVCGGGARMLLNLAPTVFDHRVYNEVDLGLCKLFACLGDKRYLYDLQALLEEWGCSEEVFDLAKRDRAFEQNMREAGIDSFEMGTVEGAACAFVVSMMSRAADCRTFDNTRVRSVNRTRSYCKRVRELELFYPTLADVEVTHGDCFEVLNMLEGRSDVCVYVDPPYTPEHCALDAHYGSRSWRMEDHEHLVDMLVSTSARVVLSGYDNRCYRRLEASGWRKVFLKNIHVPSSASSRRHDEFIWVSFSVPGSLVDEISRFDYSQW